MFFGVECARRPLEGRHEITSAAAAERLSRTRAGRRKQTSAIAHAVRVPSVDQWQCELLFVEAVRSYVDTLDDSAGEWLVALKGSAP